MKHGTYCRENTRIRFPGLLCKLFKHHMCPHVIYGAHHKMVSDISFFSAGATIRATCRTDSLQRMAWTFPVLGLPSDPASVLLDLPALQDVETTNNHSKQAQPDDEEQVKPKRPLAPHISVCSSPGLETDPYLDLMPDMSSSSAMVPMSTVRVSRSVLPPTPLFLEEAVAASKAVLAVPREDSK